MNCSLTMSLLKFPLQTLVRFENEFGVASSLLVLAA